MSQQILKIIIDPGELQNGDYVGVSQLKELYKVRKTDIVKIFDKTLALLSKETFHELYHDYIFLSPREDGKYYDVHEYDSKK